MLLLSIKEAEIFANAILKPAEPGPVLRKAAQQYKKWIRLKRARTRRKRKNAKYE